ncbi:MAG: 2Fe-2S iron-sulfur cluster binding domain-containing protein [Rickettsiaceae bacterium]|nr:MAG: 2Fe-2S iron-sulfur cluster binding domain-containing protein [Rickettsiaceae bacterium]
MNSTANGEVSVIFITGNKEEEKEQIVKAPIGLSILEVARNNDIDLEGACEGSLACATCHVIVDDKFYQMLDKPNEQEEDMLDLAFGLEETSRLGCQLILSKALDGIRVRLPLSTRNINL